MVEKYTKVQKVVQAIQLKPDTIEETIKFLGERDCTFNYKTKMLSAIITGNNGEKLCVMNNDYIIVDAKNDISICKETEFKENFELVKKEA